MNLDDLVRAINSLNADDAFRAAITAEEWNHIGPYLTRHVIRSGDVLIRQGDSDRSVYFLAQGTLQVFANQSPTGGRRIAILRSGSLVGEPGLFGDSPRMANVEAMTSCIVYALSAPRFAELTQRLPNLALELLRGAGRVMAKRMRANLINQVPFG